MKAFIVFAVLGFTALIIAGAKVLIECWIDNLFDGLFDDFEIELPL